LPGGSGSSVGYFYGAGDNGDNWWSATEYDANYAWNRFVGYHYESVNRNYSYKTDLYSVRCVQD
jgi:uncharacterized protein (TIGR02145 family)